MAGIIASAKGSEAVEQQEGPEELPAAGAPGEDISAGALRGQMAIPPELQDAYDRVVAAGKKILYSEVMAPQIQEMLKTPGEMGEKLGQGVVALLAMLLDKAGGAMPPQLVIPAGIELVAEAGAFLRDAGQKVTKEDVAEGTAVLVGEILQRAGVTLDQLPQMLGTQGRATEPDADEGAAPAAPADNDGDEEA